MTHEIDGRVLITGAAGLLGTWLRRTAPAGAHVVSVIHHRKVAGDTVAADLRDRAAVAAAVGSVRPRLVIHAAFARDAASIVDATCHVVEATRAANAGLVFISSEAVFSGDGRPRGETSRPDPVWDYGRWKVDAENLVTAADPDAAVVRLPLIVSREPEDHVLSQIRAAGERCVPSVWFTDEMRQPACADDLARGIWAIAGLPAGSRDGTWHVPGPERLSRFEIAERAVEAMGLDRSWITPAPSPRHAHRPHDLHLTGERARRQVGWSPRPVHRPS